MTLMNAQTSGKGLNEAIVFAVDHHAGQVRKGTDTPYIVHSLEVLTLLSAMGCDTETMIAGVLHDTVEDTDATIEQIEELFGARVSRLVAAHSEDKSKTWDERKTTAIEELREAPFDLACVVMADKLSNMRAIARDYERLGDKLWGRFNAPKEKQTWYYAGIIDALDRMQDNELTAPLYRELVSHFKKVFSGSDSM